ncbi:MAG TPA: hypothetical protein VNA13_01165 [Xanthomonadales bacterium]|nr:hypothetical protein [Xanthomonadales bacterium]
MDDASKEGQPVPEQTAATLTDVTNGFLENIRGKVIRATSGAGVAGVFGYAAVDSFFAGKPLRGDLQGAIAGLGLVYSDYQAEKIMDNVALKANALEYWADKAMSQEDDAHKQNDK